MLANIYFLHAAVDKINILLAQSNACMRLAEKTMH
jgi:hypothetical protein